MTLIEVDLLFQLRFLQFFYHLKSHAIWREYVEYDTENPWSLVDESAADPERKVRVDMHCRFFAQCSRSPYRLN